MPNVLSLSRHGARLRLDRTSHILLEVCDGDSRVWFSLKVPRTRRFKASRSCFVAASAERDITGHRCCWQRHLQDTVQNTLPFRAAGAGSRYSECHEVCTGDLGKLFRPHYSRVSEPGHVGAVVDLTRRASAIAPLKTRLPEQGICRYQ